MDEVESSVLVEIGGGQRGRSWLATYGIFGVMAVVGIGLLGYGLWPLLMPAPTTVEIVESNSQIPNLQIDKSGTEIVVDVAGAVERPGVYTLGGGARTGDALVAAGGLAASADRAWVAQTLNFAAPIKDGEKIYIPAVLQASNSAGQDISSSDRQTGRTNINTAGVAELDALPGIGAVRAQAIVDNRPYASTEELVTKAKIPESIYAKIKDQLTIY